MFVPNQRITSDERRESGNWLRNHLRSSPSNVRLTVCDMRRVRNNQQTSDDSPINGGYSRLADHNVRFRFAATNRLTLLTNNYIHTGRKGTYSVSLHMEQSIFFVELEQMPRGKPVFSRVKVDI